MDVLTFLKDEHDEAKQVFKQLEEAEGQDAVRLWQRLRNMLTLHEELEETYFYPELKKANTTEDLVLEAYQEHHVMDLLIEEIQRLKPSSEEWAPKIKVLQENTEHHIEEEERELFPKVRKIWDADRRKSIGEEMQRAKSTRASRARAA